LHGLYALQGRPRKNEDPVPRDPVQTHPNLRRKNAKSSSLRRGDFTSSLDMILDQTVLVVVIHAEVELGLLQGDRLLDWLLNNLQIVVHDLPSPSPSASTTTNGLLLLFLLFLFEIGIGVLEEFRPSTIAPPLRLLLSHEHHHPRSIREGGAHDWDEEANLYQFAAHDYSSAFWYAFTAPPTSKNLPS